jgi:four helix bundle protein
MARINKFEDLICWQKARVIINEIYRLTNEGKIERDFSMKDQLRRAGYSVMLNIAEGFCRRSHKEFKQFLFFAHGSLGEIQSALYICLDQEYLTKEEFSDLYGKCDEDMKIVSGLIKSL